MLLVTVNRVNRLVAGLEFDVLTATDSESVKAALRKFAGALEEALTDATGPETGMPVHASTEGQSMPP